MFALLAGVFISVPFTQAHETRPAYLEIKETGPGRFSVLWRTPVLSGMRLPVILKFPDGVRDVTEPVIQELTDSLLERRVVEAESGTLAGKRIEFVGLQATITDVLVRVQTLDGVYSTTLVKPSQPWMEISAPKGPLAVAGAYLVHGIEHILFGVDHLLFVLALVLIVRSYRVLLLTITSFTVAHSITLALATLGVVNVPGPPVEAAIALSILLVAVEIVRQERGQSGMTARWPWVVAFSFGLLHGFGFAGALTAIGLPKSDIPLALFTFNVGVEIGQLAFIGAVLVVIAQARRIKIAPIFDRYALPAATYTIGALAAFWFIERLVGFWR
ncbi:MAG: HupE/UreJ family protein [Thermodesulfobacteriota bacterium]